MHGAIVFLKTSTFSLDFAFAVQRELTFRYSHHTESALVRYMLLLLLASLLQDVLTVSTLVPTSTYPGVYIGDTV